MQVTKGVLFDTPSRAAEAERHIRRAAADAAALDGKFGDCEPAPDVVRLDGSRLSSGGQWWGRVELDPASHDLKKAWLTFKREQFLKPTETAT